MNKGFSKVGVLLLLVAGCTGRVQRQPHSIAAEESLDANCPSVQTSRELLARLRTLRDGWACAPREEEGHAECFLRKSSVLTEYRFHILIAVRAGGVSLRLVSHRSFEMRISSLGEILHGAGTWAWVEDFDSSNTERIDLGPVLEALQPCTVLPAQ